MSYQKTTGTLSQGAHPGSYNGQDAYNEMLVTENDFYNSQTGLSHEGAVGHGIRFDGIGLQRSTNNLSRGGCNQMDAAVRRLTPLECERLQGFPDDWTLIGERTEDTIWKDENGNEYPVETYKYKTSDGKFKKVSDAERYRALGNSIALPFWFYLLRRISAQYERPATMGSLFSGIGGFDLCWERCNGKGTVLWTSEIDEFCNAVLRERFPEGEVNG